MTCFYDFLNDQFRYTHKHSDEHHDVNMTYLYLKYLLKFFRNKSILYLYVPPMEVLM